MSVQFVTLVLDLEAATGIPAKRGHASITPSEEVAVPGVMYIGMTPVVVNFDDAPSPPSVRLVATDSAGSGTWTYTVTFPGVPGVASASFPLLSTGGAVQYLSELLS